MHSTVAGKKLIGAQNHLEDVNMKNRPVRFRGQLMFDASHGLCTAAGHRMSGNPARRSGWEIHPVTQLDDCKFTTLTSCKVDGTAEGRWTPFDVWLSRLQDDDGENQ